jgi:ATP-dependent DNA helicase PIF1
MYKDPPDDGIKPTIIFSRVHDVEAVNRREMEALGNAVDSFVFKRETRFHGPIKNQFRSDSLMERLLKSVPVESEVQIKVGAQVMLVVNKSVKDGLVNGSRGIVEHVDRSGARVRFISGLVMTIVPHEWKASDPEIGVACCMQIPLRIAWAITIHRSQGSTLERVQLSLGNDVFELGQSYTALSRVKSLDGLFLSAFEPSSIRANPTVAKFYAQLVPAVTPSLPLSSESTQRQPPVWARDLEDPPLSQARDPTDPTLRKLYGVRESFDTFVASIKQSGSFN